MHKTLLVLRNEIITALTRKSFLFIAFGVPLIAVLIFLAVSVLKNDASGTPDASGGSDGSLTELQTEGYVDYSGLITEVHPKVPQGILVAYPDEASAQRALSTGEITAYYVIPADYIESGDLIYVNPDIMPLSSGKQTWVMHATIFDNLLGNDLERITRARRPMDVEAEALAPPKVGRDEDNALAFYVPYATMMISYLVLIMSSSLLLNSVGDEKKTQVMEVLLLSISPRQMLAGKIAGLGLLSLLQAITWFGVGLALLRVGGQTLSVPADFQLPLSILAWGIVFFLLGYAVYASLMAGLGALAPNPREASQAIILVIWPMLVPMLLYVILIKETHGALATGLSLFPLTAPVAMMTRLAVGGVPLWQPALAVGLLLVTVFLIVRAVAGLFQARNLLSGQPLSARRYFRALLGRG
jgi:ABC-2 type transport system permease protein